MRFAFKNLVALALALGLAGCESRAVKDRRQEARQNADNARTENVQNRLYTIGAGDTLKIEFNYNEELDRNVVVRPDGYISLPYLADVLAVGKTVDEVKNDLSTKYQGVLKNPVVTVSLETAGSFKIYVGGDVANPGVFQLTSGVTALRAIMMAGGPKPTAGLKSVMIVRDKGAAKPEYLLIDLQAGMAKLDGSQDVMLESRDVVVVPKSRIANIDQFVEQYMNELIPFQKSLGVSYIAGPTVY